MKMLTLRTASMVKKESNYGQGSGEGNADSINDEWR